MTERRKIRENYKQEEFDVYHDWPIDDFFEFFDEFRKSDATHIWLEVSGYDDTYSIEVRSYREREETDKEFEERQLRVKESELNRLEWYESQAAALREKLNKNK